MLKRLSFKNWNQFESVDIDFDSRLTVLTGVNGSGKSTLIRIISKTIGWDYLEIAKPKTTDYSRLKNMFSGNNHYKVTDTDMKFMVEEISKKIKENESKVNDPSDDDTFDNGHLNIGKLVTDKNDFQISVPKETEEVSYSLSLYTADNTEYAEGNEENGINVPSHRMPYFYNELQFITSKMPKKIDSYNAYRDEVMKRQVTGRVYDSSSNPHVNLKSSLITAAIYGEGNQFIKKDENSKTLFQDFIDILSTVLPESLRFETLIIEDGELILVTETGDFLLDAVSGGIGAIIDIA